MFQGIPEPAEVPQAAQAPVSGQAVNPPAQAPQPAVSASGPNANPLDLFPQVYIFRLINLWTLLESSYGLLSSLFRAFPPWVQMLVQAPWISYVTVNRYLIHDFLLLIWMMAFTVYQLAWGF